MVTRGGAGTERYMAARAVRGAVVWYCRPLQAMKLAPYISSERVLIVEGVKERDEVLRLLASIAAGSLEGVDEAGLLAALIEREEEIPTSTDEGVAFPHALLPDLSDTVLVAAVLRPGVKFSEGKHPPIDVVFMMVGPKDAPWVHLRLLARLARIARRKGALERLRGAADDAELHALLVEEDRADG